MINFKEIYHFSRFQRGSNIFQGGGGGPTFYRGGGSNCLLPIETHITCDFPALKKGELLLCLCLTSHQQLRSYGDGATAESLIRQTDEAGNRTCDPWFTRQAVYSLHHSGSYITDVVFCQNLSCQSPSFFD